MLRYHDAQSDLAGRPKASPEAVSLAALALGESLVYMLVEEGLIDKDSVQDTLQDAIDAQRLSAKGNVTRPHQVSTKLLEQIMDALELSDARGRR